MPQKRVSPTPLTSLLARLTSLHDDLSRGARGRSDELVPEGMAAMARRLLAETRRALPRDQVRLLPRLKGGAALSPAELALAAGQARAVVAAHLEAEPVADPAESEEVARMRAALIRRMREVEDRTSGS